MYQLIATSTNEAGDTITAVEYEQSNPITEMAGAWQTDNGAYAKRDGLELVVTPEVAVPPKVTPIQYKLLFTSAERIAIAEARKTDPVLEDLYSILDDVRLTEVNLALQSTKDALDYLTFKGLIAAGRKEEILTGEVV